MRRYLILAGLALATVSMAAASLEENEVSSRLSAQATEFLNQMFGPGRANVLVTVEGEVADVQTQTEVTTPIAKTEEQKKLSLPGYATVGENEKRIDFYQKDMETSHRRGGFKINKMRVAVVLDSSLPAAAEKAVRSLLPDLLHMKETDDMSVLRAPMIAPWRIEFLSGGSLRTLTALVGGAFLVVLFGIILYVTSMRVVRVFVSELAQRRSAMPGGYPAPAAGARMEAAEAPDQSLGLGPGGIPSLAEPIDVGEDPRDVPALGRRFDFLIAKDPAEVGIFLANEPSEDLALLFAFLADAHPDLASRIFSTLPIARQNEISSSLVKLTMADPERLAMLENRIRTAVEFGMRGPDRLGRILSRLPSGDREGLLGDLMSRDPEGAQNVEKSLFPFEKISEFRPQEVRRLIVAIPYQDWGVALHEAPSELAEKILAELPAGTRNLVAETAGNAHPKSKVLEARSKILSQVYAMVARGLIEVNPQGAST